MADMVWKVGDKCKTVGGLPITIDAIGKHIYGTTHSDKILCWHKDGKPVGAFVATVNDLLPPEPPRINSLFFANVRNDGVVTVFHRADHCGFENGPNVVRTAVPCRLTEIVNE